MQVTTTSCKCRACGCLGTALKAAISKIACHCESKIFTACSAVEPSGKDLFALCTRPNVPRPILSLISYSVCLGLQALRQTIWEVRRSTGSLQGRPERPGNPSQNNRGKHAGPWACLTPSSPGLLVAMDTRASLFWGTPAFPIWQL